MRYPEQLIAVMRQDLTQHGVDETRTPAEVDQLLSSNPGEVVMMVVNSVCAVSYTHLTLPTICSV